MLRFVLKKSHLIRERFLNQSNGEMLLALTNTFGYYHFEGIEACQINILEAASKKYQIQHNPRVLIVSSGLRGEDLIAETDSFSKLE